MAWTFYNSSGEELINDGGVQAGSAVFTGKVDLGSSLLVGNAGSTGIAVSAAGVVTMAAQPCVSAYNSSSEANVTGDAGGFQTIDFDAEIFDYGGNFLNDMFTAPITGSYLVLTQIAVGGILAGTTALAFRTSGSHNRIWYTDWGDWGSGPTGTTYITKAMITDMDECDTLTMTIEAAGTAVVVDIIGGQPETWISIALIA